MCKKVLLLMMCISQTNAVDEALQIAAQQFHSITARATKQYINQNAVAAVDIVQKHADPVKNPESHSIDISNANSSEQTANQLAAQQWRNVVPAKDMITSSWLATASGKIVVIGVATAITAGVVVGGLIGAGVFSSDKATVNIVTCMPHNALIYQCFANAVGKMNDICNTDSLIEVAAKGVGYCYSSNVGVALCEYVTQLCFAVSAYQFILATTTNDVLQVKDKSNNMIAFTKPNSETNVYQAQTTLLDLFVDTLFIYKKQGEIYEGKSWSQLIRSTLININTNTFKSHTGENCEVMEVMNSGGLTVLDDAKSSCQAVVIADIGRNTTQTEAAEVVCTEITGDQVTYTRLNNAPDNTLCEQ